MAALMRTVAFLTPGVSQSIYPASRYFIASPRVTRTTPASQPSQLRLSTLMRYALTALLAIFVILSVIPASVRALRPMLRKSAAIPHGTEYVTAFSTVPNEIVAETISETLVSTKLVACVNTIPGIKSTYWWEGKVQRDTEVLLMMKTTASLVPQVIEQITKLHPYDIPEVIVQPIIAGHTPYLQWIAESTSRGHSS